MNSRGDRTAGRGADGSSCTFIKRLVAAFPRFFKKGDVIVILLLLSLSLILGAAAIISAGRENDPAGKKYAVITRGGRELARLPLDRDGEFVISDTDVYNVIAVSGGTVYMSDAGCPDRVCVLEGAISRPGQMIVCLPDRVAVFIEAADAGTVDSVAY